MELNELERKYALEFNDSGLKDFEIIVSRADERCTCVFSLGAGLVITVTVFMHVSVLDREPIGCCMEYPTL